MNALLRQTARVSDAVAEAAALRLNFPRLASVTAGPDGALCLAFLNLAAETKFSATLRLGAPPVSESKLASVQNIVTNGSAATPGKMHGTNWNRSHCSALWDDKKEKRVVGSAPRVRSLNMTPQGQQAQWLVFKGPISECQWGITFHVCAGPTLFDGELACDAHVHFPGPARLTAAAVRAATISAPAGYGRLRAICAALSTLADASEPTAADAAAAVAGEGSSCAAEAAAADETAPLHVFSNPLYSVNTPKQVC